jgi:hypothetical protein
MILMATLHLKVKNLLQLPPEWTDQFESGIQTIAVIQAGHGLLQLGSCKIVSSFSYGFILSLFRLGYAVCV